MRMLTSDFTGYVMKTISVLVLTLAAVTASAQDKAPSYKIKGEAIEACECDIFCPCVWKKDVTFEQCRTLIAWVISEGSYGETDLKGVTFVLALTKSGKNIVKTMGQWEGIIYVSDKASEAQKKAVVDFASGKWGKAFSKIDVKSAPIETKIEAETRSLTIGKIANLKITALKGGNGKIPVIENPPFSLYPKLYCAQSDVHTYDDGVSKWDFTGRNAFYGPFEYTDK